MKKILILVFLGIVACSTPKEKTQIVEASCGQCKFGAHIDDYGDAHDKNIGFCNVIRKAEVTGKVEDGKFKASSFKIVEE